MDEIRELLLCIDINLDTLARHNRNLEEGPFFKIVKLQLKEAIDKMEGKECDKLETQIRINNAMSLLYGARSNLLDVIDTLSNK